MGENKDNAIIDYKTFFELLDTRTPIVLDLKETVSMKADNTIDTIVSTRQRVTGFEKCPICQKMLKSCCEGEVYWLEKCNDFYHVSCLTKHINKKIESTEFPITCANENCKEPIELKKLEKLLPQNQFSRLQFMQNKWSRRSLTNIVICPNTHCAFYFEKT